MLIKKTVQVNETADSVKVKSLKVKVVTIKLVVLLDEKCSFSSAKVQMQVDVVAKGL